MADYAADTVIEQCRAFLDMGDGNYLYSTFADRIQDVEELTEKEKSDYIQVMHWPYLIIFSRHMKN